MRKWYENIKELRKQRGWNQSELARRVGYSDKSMISKIEKGSVDLPRSQIFKFANALNVTASEIMGDIDHDLVIPQIDTSIGKNIKYFRLLNHMEQNDLANRLNISNKTISSWECGRTEPSFGMLEDIAAVLGITKSDLVNGPVVITTTSQAARQNRLIEYINSLTPEGIEKLFERAEELQKMGYVKEGGQNDD